MNYSSFSLAIKCKIDKSPEVLKCAKIHCVFKSNWRRTYAATLQSSQRCCETSQHDKVATGNENDCQDIAQMGLLHLSKTMNKGLML